MKAFNLFTLGVATVFSMSAVSCQKDISDIPDSNNSNVLTFSASNGLSRTVLSGLKVNWSKDDQIAIFGSGEPQPYKFSRSDGNDESATAVFTGKKPESGSPYYALYPYNESSSFTVDTKTIRTSLVAEQVAVEGTFGNGLSISVCKADENNNLNFFNACAVFKFVTTNTLVSEISLSAASNLAGDLDIQFVDNEEFTTSVINNANAKKEVKLSGSMQKNKDYYMVVAPFTGEPTIKVDGTEVTINGDLSSFKAEAGKLYTFTLTPQNAKITEQVNITNIQGVAQNQLRIDLDETVSIGTVTDTDIELFNVNVTNNGKEIGALEITDVELAENGSSLILTVSDDTPFYYDDKFAVTFNEEEETSALITLESGNYVKLLTTEEAASCGYEDVMIDEDFEGDDFLLTDFCTLENKNNSNASVQTIDGHKGLKFSLSSGSCNAWLKIEPSRTYQEGYTYFMSFSASDESTIYPKFIFEPTGKWTQKVNFGFDSDGVFKDYTHEKTYPEDFENVEVETSYFTTIKLTLMFSSSTFIDNLRFTARMYRPVTNDYSGNHDGFETGSDVWKNN